MRGLILAIGFLTRLPVPSVHNFEAADLSRSAAWFPLAGALVGAIVAMAAYAGAIVDPWLGALLGVLVWMAVTGGLHLDGLVDLADALGASHRSPERFLQVLRDPHVGAFGVLALIGVVLAKLILLMLWLTHGQSLWGLLLLVAWARLGSVVWAQTLKPLSSGQGERFAWQGQPGWLVAGGVALAIMSAVIAPQLLGAIAVLALYWGYLKFRLGGMTGDCLGAGIELSECALLLLMLL